MVRTDRELFLISSAAAGHGAVCPAPNTYEGALAAAAARRFIATGRLPVTLGCPLTQQLMQDPVQTCEGNTYERAAIMEWLRSNDTDPCIGTRLRELNLIENRPIREQVAAFCAAVAAQSPAAASRLPQPARPFGRRDGDPAAAWQSGPRSGAERTGSWTTWSSASGGVLLPAPSAPLMPPEMLPRPNPYVPDAAVPEINTRVAYAPRPGPALTTHPLARAAALQCAATDVAAYQSVIGSYLEAKRRNEHPRLRMTTDRREYQFSRPDIRLFNHLMHKLERLSAVVARLPDRQAAWVEAVNPFRRQLYNELYLHNELVRAFAGSLPGGRLVLPEMDAWTLGIRRRTRVGMAFGLRQFRPANARAPLDLLGDVHTALLIDDSASMAAAGAWSPQGRTISRWEEVRNLLGQIGPLLARYADPNYRQYADVPDAVYRREHARTVHSQGFDLHFLHHPNPEQGLRTAADIMQIFRNVTPRFDTPTGQRINDLLDAYMSTLRFDRSLKPLNLVVLTDGANTDEPREKLSLAIEEHVSHVVQRGHPGHQLGIEFLQVGDDFWATNHLDALEEEVDGHHRNLNCDIVGVTHMATLGPEPLSAARLAQIMVAGIEAREQGYHRDFRSRRRAARLGRTMQGSDW